MKSADRYEDGGGIRGYWSLLVLQDLMEKVGEQEHKVHSGRAEQCGSFAPHPFPEGATHGPLTPEEQERKDSAQGDNVSASFYPDTRKFLPCHYFDYICGSSTGA